MADRTKWWLWGWAVICAPAIVYGSGRFEHVAISSATSWLWLTSIVLPGFALGSGVLAIASLSPHRSGVRLALVSVYSIVLYTLTVMFDNVPIVTRAVVMPMPAP